MDAEGRPVSGVEVGLYDVQYGNLVDNRFTDAEGHYRFVVPGGEYYLRPITAGYVLEGSDPEKGVLVGRERSKEQVVSDKMVVRKAGKVPG